MTLVEQLDWASDQKPVAAAEEMRLSHRGFIGEHLSRIRMDCGLDEAFERLYSLPSHALMRLLDAPETCHHITSYFRDKDVQSTTDFLKRSIEAEARRDDPSLICGTETWTALGDLYFPSASGDTKTDQSDNGAAAWLKETGRAYASPVTKNGLVIDYFSPWAQRQVIANDYREDYSESIRYSDADVDVCNKKVFEAIDILEDVSEAAYGFVTTLARTLMPRMDKKITGYHGGSNRRFVGRFNHYNPQQKGISSSNIATSLIHESIHTYLYITEYRRTPAPYDILFKTYVQSPWSGTHIHLCSYIHAAHVWYGLHRFWSLPKGENHDLNTRDYYLETSEQGFQDNQMISRLSEYRKEIHPQVWADLEYLQESF